MHVLDTAICIEEYSILFHILFNWEYVAMISASFLHKLRSGRFIDPPGQCIYFLSSERIKSENVENVCFDACLCSNRRFLIIEINNTS